jgi:hypothetical protein
MLLYDDLVDNPSGTLASTAIITAAITTVSIPIPAAI